MALSWKNGVKQVPWFSLAEWHEVYKQAYSNDTAEQTKAYVTLQAWKARIPKLPVGVEVTRMILHVCLCDREWTSKMDSGELPIHYENDLSLMYCTTIMKFLNNVAAVGRMRQRSLYQIAKQLEIPTWIVGLRHSAAHGHELLSLGMLRIAINILFEWLHEEYWTAQAQAMENYYVKDSDKPEEEELEGIQAFTDLIELWTGVSLYIHAGYELVSVIPDEQLRETLRDLRTYVQGTRKNSYNCEDECIKVGPENVENDEEYNLTVAQALLLYEISAYLKKNKSILKEDICNMLCENKTFLPNSDTMQIFLQNKKNKMAWRKRVLPPDMLHFWKDIIILLYKNEILDALIFKLLSIVDEERENREKRTFAASWINSIIYSFIQLDVAQSVCRTVEYKMQETNIKITIKDLNQQVQEHVHSSHPHLQNTLWLNISSTMPYFLLDINFVSKFLLHVNEFSVGLIQPMLELIRPTVDDKTKKHLLNLLKIYTLQKEHNNDISKNIHKKIFTVEDLHATWVKSKAQMHKEKHNKNKTINLLADKVVRNLRWKPAHDTCQWVECPIGLLPWQDTLKSLAIHESNLEILRQPVSTQHSEMLVAGIVNRKNLKMKSRINWDNVLHKRKIKKKRNKKNVAVTIVNRALEVVKKQR